MPEETPRLGLKTYSQGDLDWDHTDSVRAIDEHAVSRGPASDRPDSGSYDDELYYATDQNVLWGWDDDAGDWTIRGGLGSDQQPLSAIHASSVTADAVTVGDSRLFVQADEPQNADDGDVWIDTSQ